MPDNKLTALTLRMLIVLSMLVGAAPLHATTGTITRIDWNTSSLHLIDANAGWGRAIKLQNGDLLCAFDFWGQLRGRRSSDGGKTWGPVVKIAQWASGGLTNADLIQLHDGSILCFYNERPAKKTHPFAIGVVKSTDLGKTWGEPQRLYSAGYRSEEGCWEPAGLQLPSGEIQVYFANEAPYTKTVDQEITLLRSNDGGTTWSAPERVVFRPGGFRDGMPSPAYLPDCERIALAIEDNGLSGTLKPVITWTPLQDNWHSGTVGGDSPRRYGALATPIAAEFYAGAPCLRHLQSGQTLLSFQQSNTDNLNGAHMVVCIGSDKAEAFANRSYPFPRTPGVSQWWNSLVEIDNDTVMALSSTTIDGKGGLWSIKGKLVRDNQPATKSR